MFSLICAWTNAWANNQEAGDSRRHQAHHDVTLMECLVARRQHDDVIKWKYFPRNWPFVREIHRSPVNFPHKGQWRGALMFSLIYARINDWVNNREAGDLRRQHGHYDVIVMMSQQRPRRRPIWRILYFIFVSVNTTLLSTAGNVARDFEIGMRLYNVTQKNKMTCYIYTNACVEVMVDKHVKHCFFNK